jgi:TPR repeat protein
MSDSSPTQATDPLLTQVARKMSGPPDEARAWMQGLAERGVIRAQVLLGQMLLDGFGGTIDEARALAWFSKAAAENDALACNIVGGFYEDGREVVRDVATAAEYYARAASAGDSRGQFNFGRMLASRGAIEEAVGQFRKASQTATPAFIGKMTAFLRAAPIPAYRDLADEFEKATAA